jgi:hypothetical protein
MAATDVTFESPAAPATRARPAVAVLALGLLTGFVLGVLARAWMRFISDDPEFTWSGTLFIVLGFTFFATVQAIVAVVRRRTLPSAGRAASRSFGAIGMLPLFGAAGMMMLPTVVAGGAARWHPGWRLWARLPLTVVALLPVGLVVTGLVDDFGWSAQTVLGGLALILLYAAIIEVAGPTFRPSTAG